MVASPVAASLDGHISIQTSIFRGEMKEQKKCLITRISCNTYILYIFVNEFTVFFMHCKLLL